MTYFVYMLCCGDGSFYTGYTHDLDKRLKQHHGGQGGRYTRSRQPVELIYSEELKEKRDAILREREIKKMRKKEKADLLKR